MVVYMTLGTTVRRINNPQTSSILTQISC